jgi:hypothetical protein
LPPAYQGLPIGTMTEAMTKAKLANTAHPSLDRAAQRRQLDLLAATNREFAAREGDAGGAIDGVIRSYESAFRMQMELPHLLDVQQGETAATLARYGVGNSATDDFGRQCLTARRLLEAGVRFVELTHDNWDHHAGVARPLRSRPLTSRSAALLEDLKRADCSKIRWSSGAESSAARQAADQRRPQP